MSVPKVLALVGGKPILHHTLRTLAALNPGRVSVVVGHEAALVESVVQSTLEPLSCSWSTIEQKPLLGTGHALQVAWADLAPRLPKTQHLLVLNGDDSALLTRASLEGVLVAHRDSSNDLSLVLSAVDDDVPFGRAVIDAPRTAEFLTYHQSRSRALLPLPVVTGIYAFRSEWLRQQIDSFTPDHRGELPIYQLVYRARDTGAKWSALELSPQYWASANTPEEIQRLRMKFDVETS